MSADVNIKTIQSVYEAFGRGDVAFIVDNDVVRMRSSRRSNGRSVSMNLHHYFQFRDGKISYYRGTEDSGQTEALFGD